jgi:nitroreductase
MRFLDLARERRSVRRFRPDPVPEALVRQLVEAAAEAPSACNSQPWHFIALLDPDLRAQVAAACTSLLVPINKFVATAPMLVVQVGLVPNPVSMLGGLVKNKRFVSTDNGIAAAHFCLAATDLGLGTCILGWFDEKKIKKLLGIPTALRVELVHCVGYPEDGIRKARRKPLGQTYSVDRFRPDAIETPACGTLEQEPR